MDYSFTYKNYGTIMKLTGWLTIVMDPRIHNIKVLTFLTWWIWYRFYEKYDDYKMKYLTKT